MSKESENKIGQLQLLEQGLQNVLQQKQMIQSQKIEIENAISEINKSKGDVYKIVGPLMIKGESESLGNDLKSKLELYDLKIKTIDKQEKNIKDQMNALQQEVLAEIKNKGGKQG